jgi:hypothetical protein
VRLRLTKGDDEMKKLLVLVGLTLTSYGCGKFPIETRHTVRAEGTATIVHKIDVDFTICQDLPAEEKIACVETLLDILKEAVKLSAEQEANG